MTAGTAGPTLRERVWSRRGSVLVVVTVLLSGLVLALVSSGTSRGLLRPDATDPSGSAALATLLREQGVRVDVAQTPSEVQAAGPGATLLVARPDQLDRPGRAAVAHSGADVVLVAPGARTLAALAPGVERTEPTPGGRVPGDAPACALPVAVAAGPVELDADTYRAPPDAVSCYPGRAGSALVVRPAPAGGSVTVVGDSAPFTNEALARRGDAALTLGLLGAHPRLVWYLPVPTSAAGQDRSLAELVPPGWVWGAVQLLVAALLAALWRGRRFGPVVAEPLPVVVRATETTQGRARLYRRAAARDRAAAALRGETRRVLAARFGVPRTAAPAVVAHAVADRSGHSAGSVLELLDGPVPADDAALVALAADLDALRAVPSTPRHDGTTTGGAG